MLDIETIRAKLGDKTILFVDDDETIVKTWGKLLSRFFGKILVATNGSEGLQIYLSNKIDIVVSDITMPVMNGIEMAKAIRQSDELSKIIFITGHDKKEHADEISKLDCTLLTKPVDMDAFYKVVLDVLIPKEVS